jgi:hypothetical protein
MITKPKQHETGAFSGNCIQLYEDMLAGIKACKKEKVNEEEQIQTCFEIAGAYKEKINVAVREHVFENVCDEIYFFKHVKPLFQAEVEFYTYCYHITLFKTKEMETDKQELEDFYNRQLLKREKLRKEHPVFYEYVNEKKTHADQYWFTRGVNNKDSSLFDALMGRYMAIEKFEDYLKGVMSKELR